MGITIIFPNNAQQCSNWQEITYEYGPLHAPATEPTYLLLLPAVLGFEVQSQSVQFQMLDAVR